MDAEFCWELFSAFAELIKSSLQFLNTKIRYFVPREKIRILHTILV